MPPGEYYWFQVLGLPVVNRADGAPLGYLDHIIPTPGHDVYVVRQGDQEVLLPAVEDVIVEIDLKVGVIKASPLYLWACWKLMRIDLLTLFPEFFASPLGQSMLQRAQVQGAVTYRLINLREYTFDRHQVTDDRPFGGGPGMVMKIEPLVAAIRAVREADPQTRVILWVPRGRCLARPRPGSRPATPTCCSSAGTMKGWMTGFIFILMKSCQ